VAASHGVCARRSLCSGEATPGGAEESQPVCRPLFGQMTSSRDSDSEPSSSASIKVVVICTAWIFSEALTASLGQESGIDAVALVGTLVGVLAQAARVRCQVALIEAARQDALDLARQLTDKATCRVVAIGSESEDDVVAWAEAGASGYLTADQTLSDALTAIRAAARGEAHFSANAAAQLSDRLCQLARSKGDLGHGDLTLRESEVLELMDRGLSNKQIAERLSIELATVKNHVHSILGKLQVARRSQVSARLRELRIDELEDRYVVNDGDGSRSTP
jgi:two-component system nitrate/nitrite response regulator NarL